MQGLFSANGYPFLPCWCGITGQQHVGQTKFRRVHIQCFGNQVELGFYGKHHLRTAGCTHMACGQGIAVNNRAVEINRRNAITAASLINPVQVQRWQGFKRRISTGIKPAIKVHATEFAVVGDPGANFDFTRVTTVSGHQLFGVGHHQFDRPTSRFGEQIGHRRIKRITFTAEVAADSGHVNFKGFRRQVKGFG